MVAVAKKLLLKSDYLIWFYLIIWFQGQLLKMRRENKANFKQRGIQTALEEQKNNAEVVCSCQCSQVRSNVQVVKNCFRCLSEGKERFNIGNIICYQSSSSYFLSLLVQLANFAAPSKFALQIQGSLCVNIVVNLETKKNLSFEDL